MEFTVTFDGQVTIIADDAQDFFMKVEKNRRLPATDAGSIIEATLYKEVSTFIPECVYVFEVFDTACNAPGGAVDRELFHAAVDFFFHSILNTSYFVKSIPQRSTLYRARTATDENTDDIHVSNLYTILSGD